MASNTAIVSFPESKFFVHLFPNNQEPRWRYRLGLAMGRTRPQLIQFLQEVGHPELVQTLPHVPLIRLYVNCFTRALETMTEQAGGQVWLEKTPEHLWHIDQIQRLIPRAKFIHIIRNGPDVVASLYDLSQRYPGFWGRYFPSLESCIEHWLKAIAISNQYVDHSNHLLVKYEDLVERPQVVLSEVLTSIGLASDPITIRSRKLASAALIREREAWKVMCPGK
jgi:hypothetical protein